MATDRKIKIAFPDGSEWEIPARIVAEDMHKFYSTERTDDERASLDYCMNEDGGELVDWLTGNMDWSDISAHALQTRPPKQVNYDGVWYKARCSMASK